MFRQGKEYEDLVARRYVEMRENGLTEDFLDKNTLGNIKLFINTKPLIVLSSFVIEESDTVYIGSNDL